MMKITSTAFKHGENIPSEYTCEGKDINPLLEFKEIPLGTKALALIMYDPDVPLSIRKDGLWVHWVVFNMPGDTKQISKNSIPPGIIGRNTRGQLDYQGPCPPDREHRYFFKLYALDSLLNLKAGASKENVEKEMQGHIIAQAELMGRYTKTG